MDNLKAIAYVKFLMYDRKKRESIAGIFSSRKDHANKIRAS